MTMGYFRFFPKVAHVFPPFFKFSLLSNCYRTGRRSNEVTSTRLVGFVDFGSFTSAIAQPPARWVVAAQWPEIRPSLALATWLPAAGRTPSRRHGPAHRDPFRRARLRLSQISHASQFRYFNDGLKKKIGAQCLYNVFYIFTCRRQGIDESTPCGRRTGASPASSIRLHAKLLRSYPCKLSYFHCSHDFVQVGRCVTDRCPRPTGQVCQNAGNLTRHPRHVDTRWRVSLFQASQRLCADTNTTHGNAARQAEMRWK